MTQRDLNFGESFLVGTRVAGEIQHFNIDNCYSVREARQAVENGVPGAYPILAVINGDKVDKPKAAVTGFTHTPSAA